MAYHHGPIYVFVYMNILTARHDPLLFPKKGEKLTISCSRYEKAISSKSTYAVCIILYELDVCTYIQRR